VGHLALGVLVLSRQTDSPLALLLGLLTLNLFSWTFADFGYTLSGAIQWHWLDLGLSPFTGPLAFHLVTAFVGGVRRYRWPLIAAYVFFAALAASAWLAFAFPWARAWLDSITYSAIFVSGELATVGFSLTLLVLHARRTTDPDERSRTKTMALAVFASGLFGTSDFWDDFGIPIPSLTNFGTTVSALLMALASLRFRKIDILNPHRLRAAVAVVLNSFHDCSPADKTNRSFAAWACPELLEKRAGRRWSCLPE